MSFHTDEVIGPYFLYLSELLKNYPQLQLVEWSSLLFNCLSYSLGRYLLYNLIAFGIPILYLIPTTPIQHYCRTISCCLDPCSSDLNISMHAKLKMVAVQAQSVWWNVFFVLHFLYNVIQFEQNFLSIFLFYPDLTSWYLCPNTAIGWDSFGKPSGCGL